MRRFIRRRFLIAYAVIAVLVGTGAFMWARQGAAAAQYRTTTATLGTVTQSISMSGNLTCAAETDLNFNSSGKVNAVKVQLHTTAAGGQPGEGQRPGHAGWRQWHVGVGEGG